ncbi:aminoacyl-tRNA hydrolase [Brevibacterium sp. HMSC08F02]|uniref:aminoacyl-tRNA hydrolase n=1 Tax=Brevibacterium sp. HMSC08F02 TaxID=1581140 RepID=UPI0008A1F438|nr:aminoacyl-tRNA hydrolase [Brevibacterium sp. HMSC08F02]OFT26568.1 aminoacyl-tRNA hydrolase [Brevibacterium sp. HMSC08F02]HJH12836.1 aminoacyl-tRNA hydrolase [Brevibacterium ravenspurgense]
MAGTWLIVGLGNPGPRYERTRHNIGYMVVDELLSRTGGALSKTKHRAFADTVRIGSEKAVLMRSMTYMNESGIAVRGLADFYGVDPERIIAVHDDVDIPFDSIKLKIGGGEGGHNGLRSITQHIGTRDYLRLRAGVGRPPGRMDTADFVLRPFSSDETADLPIFVSDLADACEDLVRLGLTETQQRYHGRSRG